MGDSNKDGSDSDWDSTLDFTSPRQVGIGQPRRSIGDEIEEESALSNESDIEENILPNDQVIYYLLFLVNQLVFNHITSPEFSWEILYCHKIKAFFVCPNSDDTITKAQNSCLSTYFDLVVHPILISGLSFTVNT